MNKKELRIARHFGIKFCRLLRELSPHSFKINGCPRSTKRAVLELSRLSLLKKAGYETYCRAVNRLTWQEIKSDVVLSNLWTKSL